MVLKCDNCLYTFGGLGSPDFGVRLVNSYTHFGITKIVYVLCFKFLRRAFGVVKAFYRKKLASFSNVFDCDIYEIAF